MYNKQEEGKIQSFIFIRSMDGYLLNFYSVPRDGVRFGSNSYSLFHVKVIATIELHVRQYRIQWRQGCGADALRSIDLASRASDAKCVPGRNVLAILRRSIKLRGHPWRRWQLSPK